MKIMNWLLISSMVAPGVNAQAYSGVTSNASAVQSETLPIDTRKLYLNNATNSDRNFHAKVNKLRAEFPKTQEKLGKVRDKAFRNMTQDYNLVNYDSGMTFWEEFQALQNGDNSVFDKKIDKPSLILAPLARAKTEIGLKVKPDLIHFLTWMRANGVATFKSLMANDSDGILELEGLVIANKPYEIKGPTYLVTKYNDVKKALDNPEIFSVRNYRDRMKESVGDFMLGNDKKAINYEHPWMRGLIDVKEMETRIRPLVRSIFEKELKSLEYIKKNPYTGELEGNIEVVNDIARRVPAILTIEYFGFEGFSPEKIMEWSRATQDDFFHNIPGDATKLEVGKRAGQEMQASLVKLVDRKFKNIETLSQIPTDKQTILDRMVLSIGELNESMSTQELLEKTENKVYLQRNHDENLNNLSSREIISRIKARVRTNLIGTLVGGLETTQAAITQTLSLILNDKALTQKAQELSAETKSSRQAQSKFDSLIWEVLRFHPVNPVVFRYVEKDTDILGVPMKAKSHIMIATQAAMFDSKAFPNPEALVLNRFSSPQNDKYFHLGYGHHRCLGDYVSMIQVPEIIAAILELPNIRKMPGAFGELDFNKMTKRILIGGDKFDSSFPEKMILEYDSSASRPLVMKDIEISDEKVAFEGYLKDYDRRHFRGCLSGWNIVKDDKGEIIYSSDGTIKPEFYPLDKRFKTNLSDFAGQAGMLDGLKETSDDKKVKKQTKLSSLVRASQGYATNLHEGGNDLLYCRFPMKFHVCFESEANKIKGLLGKEQIKRDKENEDSGVHARVKSKLGSNQYELRNRTEQRDPTATAQHQTIFNKCATFADLTDTEKAFYENRYFGKTINKNELSNAQAQRPQIWDKDFWHEDYFSAQDRYYTRGSYANPLGWEKMKDPKVIDFYVRLNFTFRDGCVGPMIKKSLGKVTRCEAYNACKDGVYNPTTFKKEGALSYFERVAYNQIVVADDPCDKELAKVQRR